MTTGFSHNFLISNANTFGPEFESSKMENKCQNDHLFIRGKKMKHCKGLSPVSVFLATANRHQLISKCIFSQKKY